MNKADKIMKAFSDGANSSMVHLNTKQADTFIDYIIDESVLLNRIRVVRMNEPKAKVGKVGIGTKVFYPATRGQELDTNKRVQASLGSIELSSKEVIAEVIIYDDEVEDNIEGAAFKEHLMRMIAAQGRNQLEEAILYGASADSPTDILQQFDGIFTRANSGGVIVDCADTNLFADRYMEKAKLSKLYKSMPTKYRKGLNGFYMPNDLIIDFNDKYETNLNTVDKRGAYGKPFVEVPNMRVEEVATEGAQMTINQNLTAGNNIIYVNSNDASVQNGDTVVIAYGNAKQFSSVVTSVGGNDFTLEDNLPYDYDQSESTENKVYKASADGASAILMHDKNVLWGIQRAITVEPERLARLRATLFVITARMDVQVENTEALGIAKNFQVR